MNMKHLKLFESDSYAEYQYNRFYKELDYYITFFRDVLFFKGEIGRIVSIDEFIESDRKNLGIVLTKQTKRILISVGENNRVLVHYYDINISNKFRENENKSLNIFNLLTNFPNIIKTSSKAKTILYYLKESKKNGFNPILRVFESDGESFSEGNNGSNILDNILSDELSKYLYNKSTWSDDNNFYTEYYSRLVPYFIFFSSNDVIKTWWDKVKNTELSYKISNVIINDAEAYSKFKNIVDDDITDSSSLHTMGFGD